MDIAVVLPTYNERDNIAVVLQSLSAALEGLSWQAIFVDDDSPDGTADVIAQHALIRTNVRLIRRIGRRGLATACIEGMMASESPFLVVMDADLQHDERVLPQMLQRLRSESLDLVVATRNAEGGSMGKFSDARVRLSQVGQAISRAVCHTRLSDPMSGFFALRREFLMEVVHDLQGGGFKLLVDLIASARRPVRIAEVGYTFRQRHSGESKLDVLVGVEYLTMVLCKLTSGTVPADLLLYFLVGSMALFTHLLALEALQHALHLHFVLAQPLAALITISLVFFVNNRATFRNQRLRGGRMLFGAVQFLLACSLGIWVSDLIANALCADGLACFAAGSAGALFGIVWNLSIASQFTWGLRLRFPAVAPASYPKPLQVLR